MYIEFDKLGFHSVRPMPLYVPLPSCERPLQSHRDPESHMTFPIQGKVGVLTKFETTQLAAYLSSSAHQHPIPQKMDL